MGWKRLYGGGICEMIGWVAVDCTQGVTQERRDSYRALSDSSLDSLSLRKRILVSALIVLLRDLCVLSPLSNFIDDVPL